VHPCTVNVRVWRDVAEDGRFVTAFGKVSVCIRRTVNVRVWRDVAEDGRFVTAFGKVSVCIRAQ
jgi:hypothetical protein